MRRQVGVFEVSDGGMLTSCAKKKESAECEGRQIINTPYGLSSFGATAVRRVRADQWWPQMAMLFRVRRNEVTFPVLSSTQDV